MTGNQKERVKFEVKADLVLFEVLQKEGRASEEKIAKQTHIPPTSVHRAKKRLTQRDFFRIQAIPMLERFGEIPMAIIGFSNVHPLKIKELLQQYAKKATVVQFFHSEKDVVMLVMEKSMETLKKRLFEIMEQVEEKPSLYMTTPIVAKSSPTIPDQVLEAVYADLPDRRIKL